MAESQPVMAYYCKFYSVSLALKGGQNKFKRTPETDAFLANLFDDLETVKNQRGSSLKFTFLIFRRNQNFQVIQQ